MHMRAGESTALSELYKLVTDMEKPSYMIFVIFWSVWPPATPVDAASMNYSIVVTGGVLIFSMMWYFFQGRKEYKGPRIDEEVRETLRARSVVAM